MSRCVDRGIETQRVGDLRVGRVFENQATATNDDRHVGQAHVKPIEQLLNVAFLVEINEAVRMAVP
jgi:hypothetical protein